MLAVLAKVLSFVEFQVYWLLLLMVLCFPLTIWLSLCVICFIVFVWRLSSMSLSCCRFCGRSVSLDITDLWDLQMCGLQRDMYASKQLPLLQCLFCKILAVQSSGSQTHSWSVALPATDLLEGLQDCCVLRVVFQLLPCLWLFYWEAFILWGLLPCSCSRTPGGISDCWISCPVCRGTNRPSLEPISRCSALAEGKGRKASRIQGTGGLGDDEA